MTGVRYRGAVLPTDPSRELVNRLLRASLAALPLVLLTAGPALADYPLGPSEGADPGAGLSPAATIGLYVGIPLAALLLVAALVWLPNVVGANKYRPGRAWAAAPVWFAGPVDAPAAVAAAEVGDVVRGGASGSW